MARAFLHIAALIDESGYLERLGPQAAARAAERADLWRQFCAQHQTPAAIVNLLAGRAPEAPRLSGVCYNTVAPGYGFSLAGNYQPRGDIFAEVEGGATSPVDAPRELRAREAAEAERWFQTITADTFG